MTVTDRGEGIPAADLAQVFTKFFRRAEGRRAAPASGCGSAGVWWSPTAAGLVAESIRGEGSTFRFTLPLVDLEDDRPAVTDPSTLRPDAHRTAASMAAEAGAAELGAAADLDELRAAEAAVLGKRSALARLHTRLGALPPDERRAAGQPHQRGPRRLAALAAERRAGARGRRPASARSTPSASI